VYVSEKDNVVRGVSNAVATSAGHTRAADEGTRVGGSDRRDDSGAANDIQASGTQGQMKW